MSKLLRPSQTAAWVALARSAGRVLPKEQQLAFDPYGVVFAQGVLRSTVEAVLFAPELLRALLPHVPPLHAFLLWMQLRTRTLDEVLRDFLGAGGRQVILLGAGYDARAVRFRHLLQEHMLFEIDHPVTQAHKRALATQAELRSSAHYVAWDFEQGYRGLAAHLKAQGLNTDERVLTVWEGVTMYLSEPAIAETFTFLKACGGLGSRLVFNYVDQRALRTPRGDQRLTQRLVQRVGEPFRFGFDPEALPAWLSERGFKLVWDRSDYQLAKLHLEPALTRYFTAQNRRVALAELTER